jgi:hypothetical protein
MKHLKVSGAVGPLKWPLGVKWLKMKKFLLFYKFLETPNHSHINGNNKCIETSLCTQCTATCFGQPCGYLLGVKIRLGTRKYKQQRFS